MRWAVLSEQTNSSAISSRVTPATGGEHGEPEKILRFCKAMNNSTTEFVTLICYLTAKGECSCACSMANYACLLQI
jgi:hypothetical protein